MNLNPKKFLVISLLTICSCVEDNIPPPFTGTLNPAAELLVYFESKGDFVNSSLAPALINAEEVYSNLTSYFIIDLRENSDFTSGHVEGAINILNDSLWNFINSIDTDAYPKIILVCSNGQSSAYFTCLLRLAGFNNVFSMNYGMASWNQVFADEWLSSLKDAVDINNYTNDDFPKNELVDLPEITFDNPEESLNERVNSRIRKIISEGFYHLVEIPDGAFNYVVCYGSTRLYYARRDFALAGRGHPPGAIHYLDAPNFEFRSNKYLQSLPNDKRICIYDYDGQLSACLTAYFRVLGYDASSLLFGANQLFYSRMIDEPDLQEYAFSSLKINNFPYITGKE